jgi:hypothetical protein
MAATHYPPGPPRSRRLLPRPAARRPDPRRAHHPVDRHRRDLPRLPRPGAEGGGAGPARRAARGGVAGGAGTRPAGRRGPVAPARPRHRRGQQEREEDQARQDEEDRQDIADRPGHHRPLRLSRLRRPRRRCPTVGRPDSRKSGSAAASAPMRRAAQRPQPRPARRRCRRAASTIPAPAGVGPARPSRMVGIPLTIRMVTSRRVTLRGTSRWGAANSRHTGVRAARTSGARGARRRRAGARQPHPLAARTTHRPARLGARVGRGLSSGPGDAARDGRGAVLGKVEDGRGDRRRSGARASRVAARQGRQLQRGAVAVLFAPCIKKVRGSRASP